MENIISTYISQCGLLHCIFSPEMWVMGFQFWEREHVLVRHYEQASSIIEEKTQFRDILDSVSPSGREESLRAGASGWVREKRALKWLTCFPQFDLRANRRRQIEQQNGLILSWTLLMWVIRLHRFRNWTEQTGHLNGLCSLALFKLMPELQVYLKWFLWILRTWAELSRLISYTTMLFEGVITTSQKFPRVGGPDIALNVVTSEEDESTGEDVPPSMFVYSCISSLFEERMHSPVMVPGLVRPSEPCWAISVLLDDDEPTSPEL